MYIHVYTLTVSGGQKTHFLLEHTKRCIRTGFQQGASKASWCANSAVNSSVILKSKVLNRVGAVIPKLVAGTVVFLRV